jgi:hypothetical protein
MKLSLLAKVAFICNLCLLLLILTKYLHFIPDGNFKNALAIPGYVLSFVINTIVNVWVILMLLSKKQNLLPRWLLLVNGLFFILQIYLLLK